MWPWSYNQCGEQDENLNAKQEMSACRKKDKWGMHAGQGRGAPEIDIFEMMPASSIAATGVSSKPFMSSSLHISPGIADGNGVNRPINGKDLNSSQTWYEDLKVGEHGAFNSGFWGQMCGPEKDTSVGQIHKYMEDALSVNTALNESHFDSTHVYKIEWQPPSTGSAGAGSDGDGDSTGSEGGAGYVYWYLDDELLFGIDGESLQRRTGAQIPAEPLYLILNTAMSHRWGMSEPCNADSCDACWHCYDCTNPDCQCALPDGLKNCDSLPSQMKIDYVRLYQDASDGLHTVGCSPPNFPTAEFIAQHAERYAAWVPLSPEKEDLYWLLMKFAAALAVCACVGLVCMLLRRYCCWVVIPVTESAFTHSASKHEYEMIAS
jgi:hypothetical protein